VNAKAILASAARTGWGKYADCKEDGAASFNLFVNKSRSNRGKAIERFVNTLEFRDGGCETGESRVFRAYEFLFRSLMTMLTFLVF